MGSTINVDTTIGPVQVHDTVPAVGEHGRARLVAVVGPPAAGKSTATALCASMLGAGVFRLREFAERYRINHPELDHLFATEPFAVHTG